MGKGDETMTNIYTFDILPKTNDVFDEDFKFFNYRDLIDNLTNLRTDYNSDWASLSHRKRINNDIFIRFIRSVNGDWIVKTSLSKRDAKNILQCIVVNIDPTTMHFIQAIEINEGRVYIMIRDPFAKDYIEISVALN